MAFAKYILKAFIWLIIISKVKRLLKGFIGKPFMQFYIAIYIYLAFSAMNLVSTAVNGDPLSLGCSLF